MSKHLVYTWWFVCNKIFYFLSLSHYKLDSVRKCMWLILRQISFNNIIDQNWVKTSEVLQRITLITLVGEILYKKIVNYSINTQAKLLTLSFICYTVQSAVDQEWKRGAVDVGRYGSAREETSWSGLCHPRRSASSYGDYTAHIQTCRWSLVYFLRY